MKRPLLVGLAGIGALGLGLAGVVAYATRDRPFAPWAAPEVAPAPAPAPDPPAAAPVPSPSPSAAPIVPLGPISVVVPPEPAAPPRAPPRGSWEDVDPVGRPAELGAIGPAVSMALNDASAKVAHCFDPDTEARHASSGVVPVAASDGTTVAGNGVPAVLLLELETADGAVRIVDAPVESQGTTGDGVVLCAQRALRGLSLPAPGARPGERHRLRYPLLP